jgi:hypothetical protein
MPAGRQTIEDETERVRRIQDKTAPRYDRQMSFFDRVLFADGGRVGAAVRKGARVAFHRR